MVTSNGASSTGGIEHSGRDHVSYRHVSKRRKHNALVLVLPLDDIKRWTFDDTLAALNVKLSIGQR